MPAPSAIPTDDEQKRPGTRGMDVESGKAIDPVDSGRTTPDPYAVFPGDLHQGGPSRVIPLDVSSRLGGSVPAATGLALSANFVRLRPGEPIATHANATSELFYVLRGHGRTRAGGVTIDWQAGEFLILSAEHSSIHAADEDATFFWVHDEPLLTFLEVHTERSSSRPMLFRAEELEAASVEEATDPPMAQWGLMCVLTSNLAHARSLDATAGLRTICDVLRAGNSRLLHPTRSITLNLILDCRPGCHTLIGEGLDGRGRIIDPVRVDWEPASVVVIPPDHQHAHINQSKSDARFMAVRTMALRASLKSLVLDADLQAPLSTLEFASCRRLGRK
jgi:quercetin dioxygenase-like cupin family protein